MNKVFKKWFSKADTYVSGLRRYQSGEYVRQLEKAFLAGREVGKKERLAK